MAALPRIGDTLTQCLPSGSTLEMTASGGLNRSETIVVAGIVYVVAVDAQNVVVYLRTSDARFTTSEGLRVGSTVAEVTKAGGAMPAKEPGWGYHTLLPSGWNVAFAEGAEATNLPLTSESRAVWFFQRR